MPNHLANEASPYLRDHAENPVDWYPWSKEALSRAKAEDKPIFLSIGYSACQGETGTRYLLGLDASMASRPLPNSATPI